MDIILDMQQSAVLSPQLIQSVKILQMGTQELSEYLTQAYLENPVIELNDDGNDNEEIMALQKKLEWLDSMNVRVRSAGMRERTDEPGYGEQTTAAADNSLTDFLLTQLDGSCISRRMRSPVTLIIQCLDRNGYLDNDTEALAQELGLSHDLIEQAVRLVQQLDPPGVGARSLTECLLLQLNRQGYHGIATVMIRDHLECAKNHFHHIARTLQVNLESVHAACRLIRSLDPKPGAQFTDGERIQYITADILIIKEGGQYLVRLNSNYCPRPSISSYYHNLFMSTNDRELKKYLVEKLKNARWLVSSVEQRQTTLLACAEAILEYQKSFFHNGPSRLRPMSLADIAVKVQVHESTVSRALQNKYIQCRFGTFPVNYFLTRALGNKDDSDISAEKVKDELKRLVTAEKKEKPLSDQKLTVLMNESGFPVSRRTVAKYRTELGISSAAGRKIRN